MSAPTDATARDGEEDPKYDWRSSKFAYIIQTLRKMKPEERRKLSIEAGIHDENGKLTPRYKR